VFRDSTPLLRAVRNCDIPFFDFSPEVRKVIYTTNMIESINSELRRSTRNRGSFPTDEALLKVLYLLCKVLGRTRRGRGHVGRTGYVWETALQQFDIMYPGRLELD